MSPVSAPRVKMSTSAPPPAKKPKATPLLWMWTRLIAGRNPCVAPSGMLAMTACLVTRSRMSTTATRARTRPKAIARWTRVDLTEVGMAVVIGSAADGIDHQRLDDVQDDDRDHRRQVECAQRRDELAKH